jgi:hypothetical protein
MENWLTVQEVTSRCAISRSVVREKLEQHRLQGQKLNPLVPNSPWLVDPADCPRNSMAWRQRFPWGRPSTKEQQL